MGDKKIAAAFKPESKVVVQDGIKVHCAFKAMVPLTEIEKRLNPDNSNEHPEAQIEELVEQYKYQGVRHAIIISTRDGVMSAGECRYLAAKRVGMKSFPVDWQDFEDFDQQFAFVVADNAIAAMATLNLSKINSQLPKLDGATFQIPRLGIPDFQVDVADKYEDKDADEVPEASATPVVKTGDLFILGGHRLLCGDSTASDQVARLMNGEKADMVFTSPPYNAGVHITTRPKKYRDSSDDLKDFSGFLSLFCEAWLPHANYLWVNLQTLSANMRDVIDWISRFKDNLCEIAVWTKTNPPPAINENLMAHGHELIFVLSENPKGRTVGKLKRGELTNVFSSPCNSNVELTGVHNAMFPIGLVENFLPAATGNLIADPFLGAGTTLIACEKTNRKCYGMEIDPIYCGVILDRWAKFTGKTPVREDGVTWSVIKQTK